MLEAAFFRADGKVARIAVRTGRALARCRSDAAAVAREAGCAGRSAGSRFRLRPDPAGSAADGRDQSRHHQLRQQRKCPPRRSAFWWTGCRRALASPRAALCAAGHPYSRSAKRGGAGAGPRFRPAALVADAAAPAIRRSGPCGCWKSRKKSACPCRQCRMARRCASAGGGRSSTSPAPKGPNASPWNGGRSRRTRRAIISGWKPRDGQRFWLYRDGLYRPNRPCTTLVSARHVRVSILRSWPSPPISPSCAAPPIRRNLCAQAAALGYAAIGIADRNTLAGVVRAYEDWEEAGRQTAARSC